MNVARRIAPVLGMTEGQVYTAATGLVVAIALLALGLPPLRDVAPSAAVATSRPLALPASPAVADVITATDVSAEPTVATDPSGPPAAGASEFTTGPRAPVSGGAPSPTDASTASRGPATTDVPSAPSPPTSPSDGVRVTEGRYATASTPLIPGGEPGRFLPVAFRVGTPDKQSYLRLAGASTTLRLALSTEPGHQIGTVEAIRACRIVTPNWSLEDGSSLATAPEIDPIDCTLGRPGPDAWTFDLGGIDARNGVVLVPTGSSTGSFQVVFNGTGA